jgi:hypothetical protein
MITELKKRPGFQRRAVEPFMNELINILQKEQIIKFLIYPASCGFFRLMSKYSPWSVRKMSWRGGGDGSKVRY